MPQLRFELIVSEILGSLRRGDFTDLEKFVHTILSANKIICFGAGRVGLSMQAFAKRLSHLGLNAFFLNDTTVPSTGVGDLLILGSGSGETPSVNIVANLAVKNGLEAILISTTRKSQIADCCSAVLVIGAPSKVSADGEGKSLQPMTSLFEQALWILLDDLILILMEILKEHHSSMKARHNVLE